MAEIKDRSVLGTLDKDVIQDWLAHPGTIEFVRVIDESIGEEKKSAIGVVRCASMGQLNERALVEVGCSLAALERIRSILEEAQRYANSI
jgi:hypothetical protein